MDVSAQDYPARVVQQNPLTAVDKLFESKMLTVVARLFMILGGALAGLVLMIANDMRSDVSDMKNQLLQLQLQLTPQISSMKAEILDLRNQTSNNRMDINRLQDRIFSAPSLSSPTVVVTPPPSNGKSR